MTAEDILRSSLRAADGYEPSPDLWARVEGSIEEDRAHRRRMRRLLLGAAAVAVGIAVVAAASLVEGPNGATIDWRIMEGLEGIVLVSLIATLGPAIRRFGRGFVEDVFRAYPPTGSAMLRLLDVAFYLVFGGYVLVTTRFDQSGSLAVAPLAGQLSDAAVRTGGLLLSMGLLHVVTLVTLPVLGIAFTAGRAPPSQRSQPPVWLAVAGVAAIAVLFVVLGLAMVGIG